MPILNQNEYYYLGEFRAMTDYLLQQRSVNFGADTCRYHAVLYNIEVLGQVCWNMKQADKEDLPNLQPLFESSLFRLVLAREKISHRVFLMQTDSAKQIIQHWLTNELPSFDQYLKQVYEWDTNRSSSDRHKPVPLLKDEFLSELEQFLTRPSKTRHTNKDRINHVLQEMDRLEQFKQNIDSGEVLEQNTTVLYALCHSILVLCDSLKALRNRRIERDYPDINWEGWRRKRNKLIHEYDHAATGKNVFHICQDLLGILKPQLIIIWNDKFADEHEKIDMQKTMRTIGESISTTLTQFATATSSSVLSNKAFHADDRTPKRRKRSDKADPAQFLEKDKVAAQTKPKVDKLDETQPHKQSQHRLSL